MVQRTALSELRQKHQRTLAKNKILDAKSEKEFTFLSGKNRAEPYFRKH